MLFRSCLLWCFWMCSLSLSGLAVYSALGKVVSLLIHCIHSLVLTHVRYSFWLTAVFSATKGTSFAVLCRFSDVFFRCFFLLILVKLLCLGSTFCRLLVRSFCCFWCLSPVTKVGSVGCVGFLVEGTSACVLVDEAGSCLSGGQLHVWWCVLGCL